jgi:hypothetical protein
MPGLDLAAVDPGHALGVNQLGADAKPGQERGGHPSPTFVQELHQRGMGTYSDDQAGSLGVSEQHGGVLAGAESRKYDCLQPECLDPLEPRGATVMVGMHDQFRAAPQGFVGT